MRNALPVVFSVLLLQGACHEKTSEPRARPVRRAVGTLVFDAKAFGARTDLGTPDPAAAQPRPDEVDRGVATEIEVIKSAKLAALVASRLGDKTIDPAEVRRSMCVARRGSSLVLEISATDLDPSR